MKERGHHMSAPWLWIVKDKRFTTGPTIPYILGAMRVHKGADDIASPEMCRSELRDLLIAMRDDLPAPDCVVIQRCSDIKAYVVAWHAAPPQSRFRIESPHHTERALYHCKIDDYKVHDFESLFDAIWNIHEDDILERRFSRILKDGLSGPEWKWDHFDAAERQEAASPDALTGSMRLGDFNWLARFLSAMGPAV
jgi:hypothetical protein